jgi:hypothetical protein
MFNPLSAEYNYRRFQQHLEAKRIRTRVLGCIAPLVAFAPVTVHAEGSWSSALTQVPSPFESRRWTDNGLDSVSTSTTVKGCTGAAPLTVSVELKRNRQFPLPDQSYGVKGISGCTSSSGATATWGAPVGTQFFLRFTHNAGSLSATSVATRY